MNNWWRKFEQAHSLPPEVGGKLARARRREGRHGEERDDRDREKTERMRNATL